MTHMLGAVAPLAVLLEGGYNLRATAAGCEAVLRVLLGQKVPAFSRPAVPSTPGLMAIQQVIRTQVCTIMTGPSWGTHHGVCAEQMHLCVLSQIKNSMVDDIYP